MSEIDRIEVAITADPSSAVSGFQKASQAAQDFDSKIKSVGSSDFGDKVQGESEQAVTGLKKVEDAADSLSSKLKNLDIGSGLSGISKISGGLADGMQKVGLAATAVGVPVGLLAKNSISMFADLESQTQRNTALLGGAKAEYEEILALSKELGASTPFDALEIGAGIESLAAAGYSLNEIKSAMPTVAEMAIATGEDLSSMSEILIATLSSYGEGADKAAMYGDKLATVANISSAGIGDFGESMKYVGAVANAFGVDIDELGASIATLADNNLKGSLAGTGLREIITTLVNPTAKVKDIFESFGLTMDELNPKTNDFVDIMKKMKDANVSSEAMMAAFGDRAGPAAVILLEQIDKLKENYSTLLTESDGMLKEFSGKMRDTLGFVMDEMGGTIGNIMIEIGAGLKPIVQEMGKWLNENQQTLIDFAKNAVEGLTPFVEKFLGLAEKLMDWFNGLPKDMQSKIAGLTGLGAAMATIGGPLLLLGSIPVRAVSDITGALSGLFTVAKGASGAGLGGLAGEISGLGGAAGGALPNLTALLGPAGILATAGAGLAIGAWVYDVGNFRDELSKLPEDIGEIASGLATALSGDSSGWSDAGRGAASLFVDGFFTGFELVKGSPEVISNVFADAIEVTSLSFTGLVDGFYQAFKDQSNQKTITVGKPDTSEYPQAGRDAAADFVKAANDFFSSNPITAPGVEAGKTVAEEINRINQQVVIDQNNWLSDTKAYQNFEGNLADALIKSGKRVRTFSSQSQADVWNAANEWQKAFEKSGKGFEDWLKSLNSFDTQKFTNVAQEFSSTFNIELQKVFEMFSNHEIVPVKFDTSGFGNVYYEYQNGVYQPIMNNPVMIQVDEGTATGAFQSLVSQWMRVKAQIEANPANPRINIPGSSGPNTKNLSYSKEDVVFNYITGKYEKVVQQASETGTKTGAEAAAPVIAEETGNSVAEALAKSKGWYDKGKLDVQMAQEFLRKNPGYDVSKLTGATPAGTASDPLVVTTTTPTTTGSSPTTINAQNVTVSSTGSGEKKLATEDLISSNPAEWTRKTLDRLMANYSGINEYVADLEASKITLKERILREAMDAKSSGEGGSVDLDDKWWTQAQAGLPISLASLQDSFTGLSSVLQTLEKSISDGSASSTEAKRYLDEYNQATGKTTEYTEKQTSQTRDMMNATDAFTDAQTLYNKYMDDGVLSTSEATTVNAALAQGIDLMGSAGADTKDKIAGLPPALKELASSIMDFFNQIKSSVAQAQQESMYADGWRTATNSSYESMVDPKTGKPVQRSFLDIDVILGLKDGAAKVNSLADANKVLENSMYDNVGTAGLLSSAYQTAGKVAIDTMNNVTQAAGAAIANANAAVASAQSSVINQSNYMPGMTYPGNRQMFSGFRPGWRNPSPCGWGSAFESGGKVSETGTALVHEGEYILSRNEVERMGKGGANIQLNVNMNNSRFGNAEIAKDLPKLFARAARRAYFARGSI